MSPCFSWLPSHPSPSTCPPDGPLGVWGAAHAKGLCWQVPVPAWGALGCLGAQPGHGCLAQVSAPCALSALKCLQCFPNPLGTTEFLLVLPPSQLPSYSAEKSFQLCACPSEKQGCLFAVCSGWSCSLFRGTNHQADLHSFIGWLSLAKIQNSVLNRTECDIFFSSCFPEFKMPHACEGESQNRAAYSNLDKTLYQHREKCIFNKIPLSLLEGEQGVCPQGCSGRGNRSP